MHELGIADSILDTVRAESQKRPDARIVRVGLKLGDVAGVDPDALSFSFEALVKESELEPLELELERVEHRRRCPRCRRDFGVLDFETACPNCGDCATEFIGGDELEIVYLEVEEEVEKW